MSRLMLIPVVILLLAVPQILGMVPRNNIYGLRTPRTLSSDLVWYPANRTAGIFMALAAVVWLISAYLAPQFTASPESARTWTMGIGLVVLAMAVVASLVYVRSIPS